MLETQEIINQISALSYFGIWGAAAIAKFLIIVPEEAVLIVLGYMAGDPRFNFLLLIPIVISAVIASDILIYVLARRGNKLVQKFYERIFANKLAGRIDWIRNHIGKVIFFSRFLIQLRFIGPIMAGYLQIPFRKFFWLNFWAVLIYVPLYLFLGYYFRARIDAIFSGIGVLRNVLITVVIVLLLLFILRRLRRVLLKHRLKGNGQSVVK